VIAGSTTFFINHIHALLQCRDTLDIIYEVVCETICTIVTLFPRCSEDLTDLLAQKYPKLRISIDIQLIYLKGCLYLAEHVLQLHQAILKTVLSNLTAMDLEVKSVIVFFRPRFWFLIVFLRLLWNILIPIIFRNGRKDNYIY
jgi:hypothetical protein